MINTAGSPVSVPGPWGPRPSPAHLGLSLSGVHLGQISLISFHHLILVPAIYNISFSCRGNHGINWTQRSYVNYANREFYILAPAGWSFDIWPETGLVFTFLACQSELYSLSGCEPGHISCGDNIAFTHCIAINILNSNRFQTSGKDRNEEFSSEHFRETQHSFCQLIFLILPHQSSFIIWTLIRIGCKVVLRSMMSEGCFSV